MTTTYTFINPVAARLFAEWWNASDRAWCWPVEINASTVVLTLGASLHSMQMFGQLAEAFNAASQSAREIGEGKDGTSAKA